MVPVRGPLTFSHTYCKIIGMKREISLLVSLSVLLSGCGLSLDPPKPDYSSEETSQITAYVPPWKPELSIKFDSPWPTDVTREELINSALYNSYKFFDERADWDCGRPYNLHLGDPIMGPTAETTEKFISDTVSMYCDYITEPINIIGGNYDFTKEVVSSEGYESDEFGGVCGMSDVDAFAGACAYRGTAWFPMISTMRNGEEKIEGRRLTIAAHEIFHIIHDQMDPDSNGSIPPRGHEFFRAAWFVEGGGEFFGRITASYLNLYPYDKFTPTDRSGMFLDVDYLSDLELLEVRQNRAFGTENYYSGQVAMEYMIASKGIEEVFQVWLNMGAGMDFYDAFESAMGITLDEFYSLFATMHANLYDGDVVDND